MVICLIQLQYGNLKLEECFRFCKIITDPLFSEYEASYWCILHINQWSKRDDRPRNAWLEKHICYQGELDWITCFFIFFYLLFRRESRNDLYYNDNICILYSFHYHHASNWILSVSETYQVGREYIYIFDK